MNFEEKKAVGADGSRPYRPYRVKVHNLNWGSKTHLRAQSVLIYYSLSLSSIFKNSNNNNDGV
jgi:hypothetical protein